MATGLNLQNFKKVTRIELDAKGSFALVSYYTDPLICIGFSYRLFDNNKIVDEYLALNSEAKKNLRSAVKVSYCNFLMQEAFKLMGGFDQIEVPAKIVSFELHFHEKTRKFDIVDLIYPKAPTVQITLDSVIKDIMDTDRKYFDITEDELWVAANAIITINEQKNL